MSIESDFGALEPSLQNIIDTVSLSFDNFATDVSARELKRVRGQASCSYAIRLQSA